MKTIIFDQIRKNEWSRRRSRDDSIQQKKITHLTQCSKINNFHNILDKVDLSSTIGIRLVIHKQMVKKK